MSAVVAEARPRPLRTGAAPRASRLRRAEPIAPETARFHRFRSPAHAQAVNRRGYLEIRSENAIRAQPLGRYRQEHKIAMDCGLAQKIVPRGGWEALPPLSTPTEPTIYYPILRMRKSAGAQAAASIPLKGLSPVAEGGLLVLRKFK